MIEKLFKVSNKLGLHARPASLFVQVGAKYECSVKVTKLATDDEITVNGKSVMGLMMLAAAHGETLRITLEGPGEDEAMKNFETLFERKFNEE